MDTALVTTVSLNMAQDVQRLLLQGRPPTGNGLKGTVSLCHDIWVRNPVSAGCIFVHTFDRTLERLDFIRVSFLFYLLFPLSSQSAYSLVVAFSPFFLLGPHGLPLSRKNLASRGSWLARTPNSDPHAARPFYLSFPSLGSCYTW